MLRNITLKSPYQTYTVISFEHHHRYIFVLFLVSKSSNLIISSKQKWMTNLFHIILFGIH